MRKNYVDHPEPFASLEFRVISTQTRKDENGRET